MATYRSERRQQQAEATRQDIVAAARRLFAERGYAATSMSDIAAEAGVAVQTIYASCGSKRELVLALLDAIDEQADLPVLAAQIEASERPREVLALSVRLVRQFQERCGDIIAALISAAAVEPDAAAAVEEGRRRHREGCARSADKIASLGGLRKDVNVAQAAALLSTLTWHSNWMQLVAEHGFSFDDCEDSLRTALTRALLR
jgi:AcrR family transcriptional regulator